MRVGTGFFFDKDVYFLEFVTIVAHFESNYLQAIQVRNSDPGVKL